MKFEKISVKEFEKYLYDNKPALKSDSQIKVDVDYFVNSMPLPVRSTSGSAGFDITAPVTILIPAHGSAKVPTGIKVKLDKDKFLAVYIRSSYANKKDLELKNQVSIIDSDYYNNESNEGHIIEYVKNNSDKNIVIEQGSRFCQGIIQQFFIVENDEYDKGNKRTGGFGSTGTNTEAIKEEEVEDGRSDISSTEEDGGITSKEETEAREEGDVLSNATATEVPQSEKLYSNETKEPQKESVKRTKEEVKRNLKKHMRH